LPSFSSTRHMPYPPPFRRDVVSSSGVIVGGCVWVHGNVTTRSWSCPSAPSHCRPSPPLSLIAAVSFVFGPCNRHDADVNNHGEAMSKNALKSNGKAVLERELVKAILCSLWECAPTGIGLVQVARPTSRDARPQSHMRHGGKRRQPDRRSLRRFFQIPDVITNRCKQSGRAP
jgi:hypothetical protein